MASLDNHVGKKAKALTLYFRFHLTCEEVSNFLAVYGDFCSLFSLVDIFTDELYNFCALLAPSLKQISFSSHLQSQRSTLELLMSDVGIVQRKNILLSFA